MIQVPKHFKEFLLKDMLGNIVDRCYAKKIHDAEDHLKYYHENRKGTYYLSEKNNSKNKIEITY